MTRNLAWVLLVACSAAAPLLADDAEQILRTAFEARYVYPADFDGFSARFRLVRDPGSPPQEGILRVDAAGEVTLPSPMGEGREWVAQTLGSLVRHRTSRRFESEFEGLELRLRPPVEAGPEFRIEIRKEGEFREECVVRHGRVSLVHRVEPLEHIISTLATATLEDGRYVPIWTRVEAESDVEVEEEHVRIGGLWLPSRIATRRPGKEEILFDLVLEYESRERPAETGVLLLAPAVPSRVEARLGRIARALDTRWPTAIAIGGSEESLASSIRTLHEAGARRVLVVPLGSSSSDLGARAARMESEVPLEFLARGVEDSPRLGTMLADAVRNLSREPLKETVVVVAPEPREDWLREIGLELGPFEASRLVASPPGAEGDQAARALRQALIGPEEASRIVLAPLDGATAEWCRGFLGDMNPVHPGSDWLLEAPLLQVWIEDLVEARIRGG